MSEEHRRMKRERKTVEAMIKIYCKHHHKPVNTLCPQCRELLEYANMRLDRCPFQEKKPTCANCRVHCYKKDLRERVRSIMRYSGPRMLTRHPILAICHLIDGRKKVKENKMGTEKPEER